MKVDGFMLTCNRCGKKEFSEGSCSKDGWLSIIKSNPYTTFDTCPECSRLILQMIDGKENNNG